MSTVEKAIKRVEITLSDKQKNGTIQTSNEEAQFICGAIVAIHSLVNNDSDKLDNIPPSWIFGPLSGRSVNDYKYKGDE